MESFKLWNDLSKKLESNVALIIMSVNEVIPIIKIKSEVAITKEQFDKKTLNNLFMIMTSHNNLILFNHVINSSRKSIAQSLKKNKDLHNLKKAVEDYNNNLNKLINTNKTIIAGLLFFNTIEVSDEKKTISKNIRNLGDLAKILDEINQEIDKLVNEMTALSNRITGGGNEIIVGSGDDFPEMYYTVGDRLRYLVDDKKQLYDAMVKLNVENKIIQKKMAEAFQIADLKDLMSLSTLEYYERMCKIYDIKQILNEQLKYIPLVKLVKHIYEIALDEYGKNCKQDDSEKCKSLHDVVNLLDNMIKMISDNLSQRKNKEHIDTKVDCALLNTTKKKLQDICNCKPIVDIKPFSGKTDEPIGYLLDLEYYLLPYLIDAERQIAKHADELRQCCDTLKKIDIRQYVEAIWYKNNNDPKTDWVKVI